VAARGGRIHEHTEAVEFSDAPRFVKANHCKISCEYIVLATHTPLLGNASVAAATSLQTKLALYSSYVVAGRVAKDEVPDALFWDTGDPYHFLRIEPQRGHDIVIFGGEDHKTGQSDDTNACFERLERTLSELIPRAIVTHRWSGQVIETVDGLPYIGPTGDHQFAATGFSGNGMTFGTLAGMMVSDYVGGRRNPWSGLFDVSRKQVLGGVWDYIKENKDYPYYTIRDRVAGAESKSVREVPRGSGRIVDLDGEQAAVYRDESGKTTMVSAVCTHMGCLVDWNEAERTWDCPCHGSRFETNGRVIAGPAVSPLKRIKAKV
jgi:Rieske Fe-S protein